MSPQVYKAHGNPLKIARGLEGLDGVGGRSATVVWAGEVVRVQLGHYRPRVARTK